MLVNSESFLHEWRPACPKHAGKLQGCTWLQNITHKRHFKKVFIGFWEWQGSDPALLQRVSGSCQDGMICERAMHRNRANSMNSLELISFAWLFVFGSVRFGQ